MRKIDIIETTYDFIVKKVLALVNPVKKSFINTHCRVHIYLNMHGINILKNDKYLNEYNFFKSYSDQINKGGVWADQDFKSTNHFYNPISKKGLYGRKNAMDLGLDYYKQALDLWGLGKFKESMFYLGAALHLIQDMTIPQHANIRLLDDHRQYENYVKKTYHYVEAFQVNKGAYLLESIRDYIRFNARLAMKIHKRFKDIKDDDERFYRTARCCLPLAKRTTAGALVMFYKDINL